MPDRTLHRSVLERWVIEGTLVLKTPARFGSGDADPLTDMPLLLNEVDGKPLLPGSSIAGALRNYLREREEGYGAKEQKNSPVSLLFGSARESEDGTQSPLVVEDSVCESAAGFELRDGVAIDTDTRTAADEKKFDMQLLAADSCFPLRFELVVSEGTSSADLRSALVTALQGLEAGAITLGARKRRGFGECDVRDWQVWKYDLTEKDNLLDWLADGRGWREPKTPQPGSELAAMLGASARANDKRSVAHLSAQFRLDGTMLIRSGFGESDRGADTVHMHSRRPGREKLAAVASGTSLAGVLRQRALKIARTISNNDEVKSRRFVDAMFGPSEIPAGSKKAKASRVTVKESEITNPASLVVTRVKIDRFTGGASESALFSEQPLIGKTDTRLCLDLSLRTPTQAELGLLLLLLKDLWTGDLPIGGESGIGRGRLAGDQATFTTPFGEWKFTADGDTVKVQPGSGTLEGWVEVFNKELQEAQVSHE